MAWYNIFNLVHTTNTKPKPDNQPVWVDNTSKVLYGRGSYRIVQIDEQWYRVEQFVEDVNLRVGQFGGPYQWVPVDWKGNQVPEGNYIPKYKESEARSVAQRLIDKRERQRAEQIQLDYYKQYGKKEIIG